MALEGVRLKDCLEELLKFTLESSIDGALELDLGLSKEYCSNLLKDEPSGRSEPESKPSSFSEGVPPYPLYKRLASALYQSITFGAFRRTENKMAGINDNNFLKQIGEWDGLVLNKGSEIVNMLRTVGFDLHVQEPFFSQLKVGLKTIEGRCASGDYNRIGPGDLIIFNKCLVFEVQGVCCYSSFHEMLEAEGLSKVLPGVECVEAGVQIYRKFYTEEMERCSGVLAISVAKSSTQPYISLACLLSRFSYHGIQSLLGLRDTVGTVPEGVPPPRSALFSSFLLEHKPNYPDCGSESPSKTHQ